MNQDSSRSHSVFTITIETIEQGPASVSGSSSTNSSSGGGSKQDWVFDAPRLRIISNCKGSSWFYCSCKDCNSLAPRGAA
jgi:hypothetical protein